MIIPRFGQGTWNMGDSPALRKEELAALREGIALGLTLLDTAEMYGDGRSESLVGEAIAGQRDQVFLVTKVLPSNASRKGVARACEASLKRLKTDYADLYLLHWMGSHPLEETVRGFEDLLAAGKIRAWGVSNLDLGEMKQLVALPGGQACATNQLLYNLSRRGIEYDLLPWCTKNKVSVMAYSPVVRGGQPVQTEIRRDAVEPCRQPGLAAKASDRPVHAQEHLLGDVLGVRPVPEHAHGHAEDAVLVRTHERFERGGVGRLQSLDERFVVTRTLSHG